MKVHVYQVLIILFLFATVTVPVAAVVAGNGSYVSGADRSSVVTSVTTVYHTVAQPVINVSQNVGFIPLWLVIGIILIIIALGGLLWRYFHPKYVPKDDDNDDDD